MNNIKLRTKFTLAILVVVLIFGSINIILIRKSTLTSLREEIENRGLFIARSLAERSTKYLLYEDHISLQQLVSEIKKLDKDVAYSFITDNQGKMIVHTFERGFPVELIQANQLEKGTDYKIQLISDKSKKFLYRDIAVPILDGEIGIARVGIAEKNIAQQTNNAVTVLMGMVIVFLIIGIYGAYLFAYLITNPISKIVDVAETLNLDKEVEPIKAKTYDEIEYLANKFNEMVQRLQSTHRELKSAQLKLIQTEKLASIGTLASGLTHEINNPLAGLKNCLNRIKKTPNKKEILKYTSLMINALEKIENVVKGLLDFSRKRDYNFAPISINKVAEKAYSLVQYRLENDSIEVKKDFNKPFGLCIGDAHQLEQVMVNLILNSIDAMPSGGRLTLKTYQNENKIYIIVEDTGAGIPRKHIHKIFDPFFTTKETGKGTGLGLSVSYNIIKVHQGEITVESEEGEGTKFTVTLPLYLPGDG